MGKLKRKHGVGSLNDVKVRFALRAAVELRRSNAEAGLRALSELDRSFPGREDVLEALAQAAIDLQRMGTFVLAAGELTRLRPGDASMTIACAGAWLQLLCPVSATFAFRLFLERFPDDPDAGEARETLEDLEHTLPALLGDLGLQWPANAEPARLSEQVLALMAASRLEEAEALARKVTRSYPVLVAAKNNLAQLLWLRGALEEAIDVAREVLSPQPDNVHALSNLFRFLWMAGRKEQALDYAKRLQGSDRRAADRSLKVMEALALMEDDDALEAAYLSERPSAKSRTYALFHHYGAFCATRRGEIREARKRWEMALAADPGLQLAARNLEDLASPPSERHGPWAFDAATFAVGGLVRSADATDARARANQFRQFARKHPWLAGGLPVWLNQGCPVTAHFAIEFAEALRTPEASAVLRDFAQGRRGSDSLRLVAAMALARLQRPTPTRVRMWREERWQDSEVPGFRIYDESRPPPKRSGQVHEWMEKAGELLAKGQPREAQSLYEKALELEPGAPDLENNLAASLAMQGRVSESDALAAGIHQRHPDYFFGRVAVARLQLREKKFAEAQALLAPLLCEEELHLTELRALAVAQMDLHQRLGQPDQVSLWRQLHRLAGRSEP